MPIIQTDPIPIKWSSGNKSYYVEKGYIYTKMGDTFYISYKDLPIKSMHKVKCKCDYCGKEFNGIYRLVHTNIQVCCKNKLCKAKKMKETNMKRYGVSCSLLHEDIKKKTIQTNLKRYGTTHPKSSDIVKTNTRKSMQEKYGVDSFFETQEFKEKAQKTWGNTSPAKNEQVINKMLNTKKEKGQIVCSLQQQHCCDILNGELNVVIGKYTVDILLDDSIFIECDFFAHFLYNEMTKTTEQIYQDMKNKDDYLLSKGYKGIHLINHNKSLPNDTTIKSLVKSAIKELESGKNILYITL